MARDCNALHGVHATLPPGLLKACEIGQCDKTANWLNSMGWIFERCCAKATNMDEVYPPLEAYLIIEQQAQALGLGDSLLLNGTCIDKAYELLDVKASQIESDCLATLDLAARKDYLEQYVGVSEELQQIVPGHEGLPLFSFCDGLLDPEYTSVVIEPPSLKLLPGETATLTTKIECGLKECEGLFYWVSEDPSIASVAETNLPVSINEVTGGTSNGTTTVYAVSEFAEYFSSFETVQQLTGQAMITVESNSCPPSPRIPDCAKREIKDFVESGPRCNSGTWTLPDLNPEDEAFIHYTLTDCCNECCEKCGFGSVCDDWVGWSAQWNIVGQHGAQLNWDNGAKGGGSGEGFFIDEMWERGNNGSCGHPMKINFDSQFGVMCWAAQASIIRRVGWNRAGTSFGTTSDIGSLSSWCGSLNEPPCGGGSGGGYALECRPEDHKCTTDRYWKTDLETGDKLEFAIFLYTGGYGGTIAHVHLESHCGCSTPVSNYE